MQGLLTESRRSVSALSVTGMISVALVIGSPLVGRCGEGAGMAGNAGWEAFAETVALGSFAWAGEDEAFSVKRGFRDADRINVEVDATAVDIALLTGIAAPEPPALVLAGLAFGGVLCGRSLVMRRRKAVGETISESETPLA